MQKIMSIVSSVILISVGAHASPVIAGNDIPKRYHGLWQENNAEGIATPFLLRFRMA